MKEHNQEYKKTQQPETGSDELSQREQEKISGGWGEIKGESPDDKYKDS